MAAWDWERPIERDSAIPSFDEGPLSEWYFVPGVIEDLLLIQIMNLTAIAVVRERETGTLE
jgi:hypothetical protein